MSTQGSGANRRPESQTIRGARGEKPVEELQEVFGRAPEELLVLGWRYPGCSSRLNVRVTIAPRELLQQVAETELPIETVLCEAYHYPKGPSGESVELHRLNRSLMNPGRSNHTLCQRVVPPMTTIPQREIEPVISGSKFFRSTVRTRVRAFAECRHCRRATGKGR